MVWVPELKIFPWLPGVPGRSGCHRLALWAEDWSQSRFIWREESWQQGGGGGRWQGPEAPCLGWLESLGRGVSGMAVPRAHRLPPSPAEDMFCPKPPCSEPSLGAEWWGRGKEDVLCLSSPALWYLTQHSCSGSPPGTRRRRHHSGQQEKEGTERVYNLPRVTQQSSAGISLPTNQLRFGRLLPEAQGSL